MILPSPEIPHMTPREYEVGSLVARGFTDKQIAGELRIGYNTVRCHVTAIAWKLKLLRGRNTRVLITRWWLAHLPANAA